VPVQTWTEKLCSFKAKMVKASLVLFPAQNISVYTISLANVSDSLDATMASKCCRREVCEFGWGWRDGCSNGSRSRFLKWQNLSLRWTTQSNPQAEVRRA